MPQDAHHDSGKQRSPRDVKSAASLLQKEARRILRRHAARIGEVAAEAIRASVAAIDTHRAAKDWVTLESDVEQLDELLQQHAAFARKSALREMIESVLFAFAVAMFLRSAFYEPFKIPSGSMKPTLREGDHIFVNKFRYGVQIPFTSTILAPDLVDGVGRGEVIVFRYPLDTSEDFIKRVIGLPGDSIRVDGGDIWIKRPDDESFEKVLRRALDEPCENTAGPCKLFEETIDGRTYMVRYMTDGEPRSDQRDRVLTVPPDHVLVFGDNRNESMDSLRWQAKVEAVSASRLLSMKDLRDLTSESVFSVSRSSEGVVAEDPLRDGVQYLANRRAPEHDLRLDLWRKPTLGVQAVFAGILEELGESERLTVRELADRDPSMGVLERDRTIEVGLSIDTLAVAQDDSGRTAVFTLEPSKAVFRLRCGASTCASAGSLATRIADVLRSYQRDHARPAREMLEQAPDIRYARHWRSRDLRRDRFLDARFLAPGANADSGSAQQIRLRAWRHPEEGAAVVRSAALRSVGATRDTAEALATQGGDLWRVADDQSITHVLVDATNDVVILLECGRRHCATRSDADTLLDTVRGRIPAAAADRRKLRSLLTPEDLPTAEAHSIRLPDQYEWERIALDATVRGGAHFVRLAVRLRPAEGLGAAIATWRNELAHGATASDGPTPGAWHSQTAAGGHQFVFGVAETKTAISLQCGVGLCPDLDTALALAKRVAAKATDETGFVDHAATRAQPYVPRGNIKGRAERIWLPTHRFWKEIR
ncbi:MAG: signal peptidase I [Nannocystaceae bacterium]